VVKKKVRGEIQGKRVWGEGSTAKRDPQRELHERREKRSGFRTKETESRGD